MRNLLIAALLVSVPAFGNEEIIQACTALVHDYAFHRDRRDAEEVADLFTRDARLLVLGQTYAGREAIAARLRAASSERSLHLMSTIKIEPQSPDTASGTSYATVYIVPDEPMPTTHAVAPAVGIYLDQFERTEAGWKIAERKFVPHILPSRPE